MATDAALPVKNDSGLAGGLEGRNGRAARWS